MVKNAAYVFCGVLGLAGLLPGRAATYDYYPIYNITFEAPYHTEDTLVSIVSNVPYAPSSMLNTYDTDGPMIRAEAGNQFCEFDWTGATGTTAEVRLEQIRMDLPQASSLRVHFDMFIPWSTTNYLQDYFELAVLMDTISPGSKSTANSFIVRGDGHFWNGTLVGSYQTGVWHRAAIVADLYYHTYDFLLDDEPLFSGALAGDAFVMLRFSHHDSFGRGGDVYLDNISVSTGIIAKAAAYNIAESYVVITDSDPHLIYGTSTVNRIRVGSGVAGNVTISNLNVQSTNRFQTPFIVESNATLHLMLVGSNRLESGEQRPALYVTNGTAATLSDADGSGMLTALGGNQGPGIGGGGAVTITGGTIVAIGGEGAAGIGSGDFWGNAGIIAIAGGTVWAQGGGIGEGGCGAGIGGGNARAGGVITISGGRVTALGGSTTGDGHGGAGIGGGNHGAGGLITISGGTVQAVRGGAGTQDIGDGYESAGSGTNIFIGGSIKTSANAVYAGATDAAGNAVHLLVVSNAANGIDPVSLSLTNWQTGAVYSYAGSGHGPEDPHLYFYLPVGDYLAETPEQIGFFVQPDGASGTLLREPSAWTDEQKNITSFAADGHTFALTLGTPLCTRSDNFRIEGANKVEDDVWNWSTIPFAIDEHGVVIVITNAPSLMLRPGF